jgi:hypothetical protein
MVTPVTQYPWAVAIVSIHVSAGTVVAHPGHQIVQARAGVGRELVAGVG